MKRTVYLVAATVVAVLLVVAANYLTTSQTRGAFDQFASSFSYESAAISISYFDGNRYQEVNDLRIADSETIRAIWDLCRLSVLKSGKHTGIYSYTVDVTFIGRNHQQSVTLYKDSGEGSFVGFLGKTISISGNDPKNIIEELARRYIPSLHDGG